MSRTSRCIWRGVAAAVFAIALAAHSRAQLVLNAHPGPSNNGGFASWAQFFDLTATSPMLVTHLRFAYSEIDPDPLPSVQVEVFTRSGTALGGSSTSGPGSSPAGWTSLGIFTGYPANSGTGTTQPIQVPPILVNPGQTTGVALLITGGAPRYWGLGNTAYSTYTDGTLSLTTGDSRSFPFTTVGELYASRQLVGGVTYTPASGAPTVYCTAGVTTQGCSAHIAASGLASASASAGFNLSITGAPGQRSAAFFYGINGSQANPWVFSGTSYLCVVLPTQRTPAFPTGGSAGACDGQIQLDWLAFIAANPLALGAPLSSGQYINAQAWYRDPPAPHKVNLSDAVQFRLAP
jgi:hypothetical protein